MRAGLGVLGLWQTKAIALARGLASPIADSNDVWHSRNVSRNGSLTEEYVDDQWRYIFGQCWGRFLEVGVTNWVSMIMGLGVRLGRSPILLPAKNKNLYSLPSSVTRQSSLCRSSLNSESSTGVCVDFDAN
jgi:hypothetical protein